VVRKICPRSGLPSSDEAPGPGPDPVQGARLRARAPSAVCRGPVRGAPKRRLPCVGARYGAPPNAGCRVSGPGTGRPGTGRGSGLAAPCTAHARPGTWHQAECGGRPVPVLPETQTKSASPRRRSGPGPGGRRPAAPGPPQYFAAEQKGGHHGTGGSRVIPRRSTGPAQPCLTSEIGRDRVRSEWFDRGMSGAARGATVWPAGLALGGRVSGRGVWRRPAPGPGRGGVLRLPAGAPHT
jgi:hypothetical protein